MIGHLFSRMGRIGLVILMGAAIGCATAPAKPPSPPAPPVEPPASSSPPAPPEPVVSPVVPPAAKDPFAGFPERYRQKALEYEKARELLRALQSWRIVKDFVPDDTQAAQKIRDLQSKTEALADQHFKRGVSLYQSHSLPAARKEFLLTLRYNPEHREALSYLKDKLAGEDFKLYEVKKGDTPRKIASEVYRDPRKDFLIAHFNNLGKDAQLAPPMILRLPALESTIKERAAEPEEPAPKEATGDAKRDTQGLLKQATDSFRGKKYRETAAVAEKILEMDPVNKEAGDLVNASYYQMGKTLSQEGKYPEALAAWNRVDPGYRDVRENAAAVKKKLADIHYLRGVKYFVEEDPERAIKEWETTLTLDPNHPKARKDIETAQALLQKLKGVK